MGNSVFLSAESNKNSAKLNEQRSASEKREPHKIFVYLTCLYILTWYLQLGNRISLLGTVRFEFLLGSLLSVCAFYAYAASKTTRSPFLGPVLFFICILLGYTFFSYDFYYSWEIFFNRVVKFAMLAFFLAAFIRTPWALKMVVGAFLLAMLKLGQEGFIGWWTGALVWENQGVMRLHGSVPLYQHPNSFSGMAVGCLPFIYYLFPVVSKCWKALLIILLFFCGVIILFTASRTGYVAALALALFFFANSSKKDRVLFFIAFALFAASAFYLTPTSYQHRFQSIFTLKEKEGASASTRLEIIQDAVDVYLTYPFGVGVGAFPLVRQAMFGRSQDTHNLYLELLTNLGPLGLIAFLILVYKILITNNIIQKQIELIDVNEKKFIKAVSKAIKAFIVSRLFLGIFGMDTYEIYWWFSVGLTSSMLNICFSKSMNN